MIPTVNESNADPFADLIELLRFVLDEAARRSQGELPGIVEAAESAVIYTAELSESTYGHYRADSWTDGKDVRPEIVVNANFLDRGPEHLVLVIVHELAHAFNKVRGVRDTCRDGRYHNRNFGEIAATLGLRIERVRSIGINTPGLSPSGQTRYAEMLAEVKNRLHLARQARVRATSDDDGGESVGGTATGEVSVAEPKYVFASCECISPTRHPVTFRMARGSWTPGSIDCRTCGSLFRMPDEEVVGVSTNATPEDRP